jgi:replication factor C subunit 1
VNASDARGKSDSDPTKGMQGKTANFIRELCTNTSFRFSATSSSSAAKAGGMGGNKGGVLGRKVIVMDEVDGMSAGDRGGVADLIQTIHKTKVRGIAPHVLLFLSFSFSICVHVHTEEFSLHA